MYVEPGARVLHLENLNTIHPRNGTMKWRTTIFLMYDMKAVTASSFNDGNYMDDPVSPM